MNQLIAAIAYHGGDASLVIKHLNFMQTLGGCKNHVCLLFPDSNVVADQRKAIKEQAQAVFGYVESRAIQVPAPLKGHQAANQVFAFCAGKIRNLFRLPFLWLEPDATFVKQNPMDRLADAYYDQPKKFMGCIVKVDRKINSPKMPDEMLAGVAVYPNDAIDYLEDATKGEFAWDITGAKIMVQAATNTPLIHHFWGTVDLLPTFKRQRAENDAPNVLTPAFVAPDAVVFHRCKDGTLIDALNEESTHEGKLPGQVTAKRPIGRPRKSPFGKSDQPATESPGPQVQEAVDE